MANFDFKCFTNWLDFGDGNRFFAGQGSGRVEPFGATGFCGAGSAFLLAVFTDFGDDVFGRPAIYLRRINNFLNRLIF